MSPRPDLWGVQPTLHRDIYHLCKRFQRRRVTDKVVATGRRLMLCDPTPDTIEQWLRDLRLMVDIALAPSPYFEPTSEEIYVEKVAKRVKGLLETLDGEGFIARMRDERVA